MQGSYVKGCSLSWLAACAQGKPYRYGYVVSAVLPTSYGNALAKIDVAEGTAKRWHEPGCIPVEPIMVPRPGAEVAP
jgi:carlactone synthase/all-trans-10'-apo-beta-carotenal 13,14-cleaving dioxygenase